MDVSVVIVNYNTADILPGCIESVRRQKGLSFEIVIIDNASQDASEAVLNSYGDAIKAIFNKENAGFGKANNQAFPYTSGRYIFLMNPDAVLGTDSDLQNLVTFMDTNPQYGLVGTRILKATQDAETRPFLRYPGQKNLIHDLPALPGKIAWVLGASMVIPRKVYELVGGFDEDYFLYGEEADLCLRIRKKGYPIGYCEGVAIEHIGGASERRVDVESIQTKKQNGLHLFYRKHYHPVDVVRLVRRNLLRAQGRLALMNIKKFFSPLTDHQKKRYAVYKAINRSSQGFLKNSVKRDI